MLVMADPKKSARGGSKKAPKPDGDAKPNRAGKPINVWIPEELFEAFEAYRNSHKFPPKKTDVVELAIQEYLKSQGYWPPKDAAPTSKKS